MKVIACLFAIITKLSVCVCVHVPTVGPVQQSCSASGPPLLQKGNLIMVFTSVMIVNTFILLVPPHLTLLIMQTYFL